jgi:hypothetical protein
LRLAVRAFGSAALVSVKPGVARRKITLPYIAFLARIRRLFTAPSPYLDVIADAFANGQLKQPAQPMSDQELARAIREFQNVPLSESSLKKLGSCFKDPKPEK